MSRRHQSPAERQEKLDAAHQKLIDALSALTTSDDWCRYLGAMGRFRTYSTGTTRIFVTSECSATADE